MESARETIGVRTIRLNNQILAKQTKNSGAITKECLLDAFQVLYNECNCEFLKKQDKNIQVSVNCIISRMLVMLLVACFFL